MTDYRENLDKIITEHRRKEVVKINSEVMSGEVEKERERLEEKYEQVWDTQELQKDFSVKGFAAPYCIVKRISDNKSGIISFQHNPRFYFNFIEE